MLQFYVTGEGDTEERVVFQGTHGRIVLDPPAHVPTSFRVLTSEGGARREDVHEFPLPADGGLSGWNYPGSAGFRYQIEEVGRCLREGRTECPRYTLDDSVQVAAVLEEILNQVHGRT